MTTAQRGDVWCSDFFSVFILIPNFCLPTTLGRTGKQVIWILILHFWLSFLWKCLRVQYILESFWLIWRMLIQWSCCSRSLQWTVSWSCGRFLRVCSSMGSEVKQTCLQMSKHISLGSIKLNVFVFVSWLHLTLMAGCWPSHTDGVCVWGSEAEEDESSQMWRWDATAQQMGDEDQWKGGRGVGLYRVTGDRSLPATHIWSGGGVAIGGGGCGGGGGVNSSPPVIKRGCVRFTHEWAVW